MSYHAEFGRFALKGVGINTAEPRKLGSPDLQTSQDDTTRLTLKNPYHGVSTFIGRQYALACTA